VVVDLTEQRLGVRCIVHKLPRLMQTVISSSSGPQR
jgi:hypothetical protein